MIERINSWSFCANGQVVKFICESEDCTSSAFICSSGDLCMEKHKDHSEMVKDCKVEHKLLLKRALQLRRLQKEFEKNIEAKWREQFGKNKALEDCFRCFLEEADRKRRQQYPIWSTLDKLAECKVNEISGRDIFNLIEAFTDEKTKQIHQQISQQFTATESGLKTFIDKMDINTKQCAKWEKNTFCKHQLELLLGLAFVFALLFLVMIIIIDTRLAKQQRKAHMTTLQLRLLSQAFYDKAKREYDQKEYERAVDTIDLLIKHQTPNAMFYHLRALAFMLLEEYNKALESITAAREIEPDLKSFMLREVQLNNIGLNLNNQSDNQGGMDHIFKGGEYSTKSF